MSRRRKSGQKGTENPAVSAETEESAKVDAEIVDTDSLGTEVKASIANAEPDLMDIEVKNPRIGKVLSLQEEAERQNAMEKMRSKRIRQEQEYIDKMITSVEENLRNTREEQKYNEEFEQHIKEQVYRMHGISEDKLQGMTEARRAWYQGAAFALFFLSLVLIALCGSLHGFGSELCVFMAFYTAIEGALLSNGRKQSVIFEVITKVLYLLLFPMMMVVFVCYELGFEEYNYLVPVFTVAGVVILVIGAVSYFIYDPYRMDRRNQKKANRYIREMEKTAWKEVRLKKKAFEKQERKKEKLALRAEKKQKQTAEQEEKRAKRRAERREKKESIAAWWAEKIPWKKPVETEVTKTKEAEEEKEQHEAVDAETADILTEETADILTEEAEVEEETKTAQEKCGQKLEKEGN